MTATPNREGAVALSARQVNRVTRFWLLVIRWWKGEIDSPFTRLTTEQLVRLEDRCARWFRAFSSGQGTCLLGAMDDRMTSNLVTALRDIGSEAALELYRRRHTPMPIKEREVPGPSVWEDPEGAVCFSAAYRELLTGDDRVSCLRV
jgi:hypothetical protein